MRRTVAIAALACFCFLAASPLWAQEDARRPETLTDKFPWLPDFVVAILAVGLLCLLVYLFRPTGAVGGAGFSIVVDGEEVIFKGRFPAAAQSVVEEFLVQDCRIPGSYTVVGNWNEGQLAVSVRGAAAKLQEQRIRNFLKLNVKRPE